MLNPKSKKLAPGTAARVPHAAPDEKHWREHFERTYANQENGPTFEQARRAYHFGWGSYERYNPGDRTFDELEDELRAEWEAHRGNETLEWAQARPHARDAFEQVRSRSGRAPDMNAAETDLTDENENFDPDADPEIVDHLHAAEFEQRRGE